MWGPRYSHGMAFETGGYADKLGNRYEARYVLEQLLYLLQERLKNVVLELVGDQERGVDLSVMDCDGVRRAIQCKARNASKSEWSVADLAHRDVLKYAKRELDSGEHDEYWFVSGVAGHGLGDICDSARSPSGGDPEEFYQRQLKGKPRQATFESFCQQMELDSSKPADRALAYGYLQRMRLIQWTDDAARVDHLEGWADTVVSGNPKTVLAVMTSYAEEHLREAITVGDLWNHLESQGLYPRRLPHDVRVMPAISECQKRFLDSICPNLIDGTLLHRKETDDLLAALESKGVVVLHGAAGVGKSGVLYELAEKLGKRGDVYVPIRLDRVDSIPATTKALGELVGLPESPGFCAQAVSGNRMSVVVLDQLDALRWTSRHSAGALDTCKAVVREVKSFRDQGAPVCIVLACRTFDLDTDSTIKGWLQGSEQERCARIKVDLLSEDTASGIVAQRGGHWAAFTPRQKSILRSPHYLSAYCELCDGGVAPSFQNGTQLISRFWACKYKQLQETGCSEREINEAVEKLVDSMENGGKISAPIRVL